MLSALLRLCLLSLLCLIQPLALAADWGLCAAPSLRHIPLASGQQSRIEADRLTSPDRNIYQFDGDVTLTSRKRSLHAGTLRMNRQTHLFSASGQLQFNDDLFSLSARQAAIDERQHSARFEQVEFQLYDNHLHGSAATIVQLNADQSRLYHVAYSTCDPEDNAWSLNAGELRLDRADGRGNAYNAVLKIAHLPVFYFPWLQFPLDDRRMSGLLTPTLTHTGSGGLQLNLPLYWNQADNYDMTFTPVFYSLRGLQLNSENRYLFGTTATPQTGQVDLSWLDDQVTHRNRWLARWTHHDRFDSTTEANLLLQRRSDNGFARDFSSLGNAVNADGDVDFLPSRLDISGQPGGWTARLKLLQYQTLNPARAIIDRPYQTLPALSLQRRFKASQSLLTLDWNNEWTRFDREHSVTGDRWHITPRLSYPIEHSGYFFKPELQLDLTHYTLHAVNGDQRQAQRSLPLLSIDSGLIFERIASTQRRWRQTLEPRLYLLYAPYRDQSALPNFDTALLPENLDNLFINNRFSGADRIGDSRQLSVVLSTRLLDQNGNTLFSASIGQAFYDQPRRVSLNNTVDKRKKSSLMMQLKARPQPQWDLQLSSVYDQQIGAALQNDLSLRHHHNGGAFNLDYHFRRDKLEQSTVSLVYPLSSRWHVFAKRQHSLLHDLPVQNLFGLAYESCCWGFKMLYQDSTDKNFENRDQAIYFQLTLKGLSNAGKDIDSLLENAILGYQPVF